MLAPSCAINKAQGTTVAAAFDGLMAHLRRVSAVRWGHAVADDFFSKQLPNNVTWLLTLMYSLDQSGAHACRLASLDSYTQVAAASSRGSSPTNTCRLRSVKPE